ncbi:hypothetical protein CRG98_038990 [Punica granatum]|uniref:Uncharacterized protein n=1 Tax=Punica granatum TaxID=22663 RepID=A0A2I0IA75_PUNGR|nr:hypothetical protein CRG98_038990 [Punica granatum]
MGEGDSDLREGDAGEHVANGVEEVGAEEEKEEGLKTSGRATSSGTIVRTPSPAAGSTSFFLLLQRLRHDYLLPFGDGFGRSPDEAIVVVEAGERKVEWVDAGAMGSERKGRWGF